MTIFCTYEKHYEGNKRNKKRKEERKERKKVRGERTDRVDANQKKEKKKIDQTATRDQMRKYRRRKMEMTRQ